jgi:hypothetical protein
LALTIHAGALITFAILLNFRQAIPHVRDQDLVRVYRSFGAGIGLSMGVLAPAEIYRHCTTLNPGVSLPDALALDFGSAATAAWSLRMLALLALWVSYIWLEVWTNEPTRRLDQKGEVADSSAFSLATTRVARHLAVNAGLAALVVIFGAWAAAS